MNVKPVWFRWVRKEQMKLMYFIRGIGDFKNYLKMSFMVTFSQVAGDECFLC